MGQRALLQKLAVVPQRCHLLAHVAHTLCLPAHEHGRTGLAFRQSAFLWRGERTPYGGTLRMNARFRSRSSSVTTAVFCAMPAMPPAECGGAMNGERGGKPRRAAPYHFRRIFHTQLFERNTKSVLEPSLV